LRPSAKARAPSWRSVSGQRPLDEIAPGYVAVARVLATRGVHGDLKAEPLAPTTVLAPGRTVTIASDKYEIERSRRSGRFIHLKLAGIDTREQAQALRGAYLLTPERDLATLPEGEYYRFQLIGLSVRSEDGRELGHVIDVISARENDVYVVSGPFGEVLIPAVDDVIRDVNISARVILIEIIPGLLP